MFLLRHGQSVFNQIYTETRVDPGIEDPELTPLGHAQARQAAAALRERPISRIIVSPYTRALQTAAAVLEVHPVPVEIMHEVRERCAFVCDIGSAPARLAARFPGHDFAHLPERWWPSENDTPEDTIARANAFRRLMAEGGAQPTTLLVSHWGFILALTGISLTNGELLEYDPRQAAPERIVWRP